MIDNLDKIKEVAQKDLFINEIAVFVENLIAQDKVKALYLLKNLFFAPEIHPRVRYMLAQHLGKIGPIQLFQQLLSYFILNKFPDTLSLIAALRSFGHIDAVPALMDYYPNASFREQLEIIDSLAHIAAPETVEFLSQIYNEQIDYAHTLDASERNEIRHRASSALSKKIMRFDPL
jgi:hypothetical protein